MFIPRDDIYTSERKERMQMLDKVARLVTRKPKLVVMVALILRLGGR